MFDELTHPDEAGVHLQHPGLPPLALPLRLDRLAGGELHHRALGVLRGVVMCQYLLGISLYGKSKNFFTQLQSWA